jgi:hypothetical protein
MENHRIARENTSLGTNFPLVSSVKHTAHVLCLSSTKALRMSLLAYSLASIALESSHTESLSSSEKLMTLSF